MHRAELICYATQRGCSYADAEDLVQDVWLKLARTKRIDEIDALPADEQIAALKMRLRSEMINSHRARLCHKRGSKAEHVQIEAMLSPPATHATPHDALHLAELRTALASYEHLDEKPRGSITPTQRTALYRARQAARLHLAAWWL